MLHRQDGEGVIIITQPAHAWVSGQIAQQWGNERFHHPAEEVRFATEQHDVGFLDWEQAPRLNPKTGLPYKFTEMPTPEHLEIWQKGILQVLRFSRYAALLVSKHFTVLARRHDTGEPPCADNLVHKFIGQQATFQNSLLNALNSGATVVDEKTIERDYKSLAIWDWISLLILMNEEIFAVIPDVPDCNGRCELRLKQLDEEGLRFGLEPWPFPGKQVEVRCEGKLLREKFSDEQEMRNVLHSAQVISLPIQFLPA